MNSDWSGRSYSADRLAAFTRVGAAVELASLRHSNEFDQFIPWFVLALAAVGIVVLTVRRSPPTALIAHPDRVVHADGIPARLRTAVSPSDVPDQCFSILTGPARRVTDRNAIATITASSA